MHPVNRRCQQFGMGLAALALAASLAFAASPALAADECESANAAVVLAAAQSANRVILKGADAMAFAQEARDAGVPMPDPDYVFLDASGPLLAAEWLEGAGENFSLSCGWRAKAGSRFGKVIAQWAQR